MASIIIDTKSIKDTLFLTQLAKKMGYSSRILSDDEKEEMALLKAMKEGRKKDYLSRESVMKKLDKWL
jgi:hypothetical protein